MRRASPIPFLIFLILAGLTAVVAWLIAAMAGAAPAVVFGAIALVAAALVAATIQIANQWERAIVLRLGRFQAMRGPGMFFIIPVVDVIPYWIDTRVMTSTFKAEKTLTKDTVPVDVDAVLFWKVVDPQKAAIDVEDFVSAISWASQTALRDVIGKTMLSDMLEGREKIGQALRHIIDERSQPWGVNVISVELKDVLIPGGLEDAMSMQAQAERERQARIILGDSERQVAESFQAASASYADNPTAFHLRAMNMLYEGLKHNSTIVIVPSTAVESMQLGGLAGVTALTQQIGRQPAPKPAVRPAA